MSADFKLVTNYAKGMPMKTLAKATETVLEAGDMVDLTSGLATKASASSTSLAFTPHGAPAGVLEVQVLNDENAEFIGTADAVFAVANRGAEVDLVMSGTQQQIDLGTSTTDVFKVSIGDDAGVVDSALNVKVRINKFLY